VVVKQNKIDVWIIFGLGILGAVTRIPFRSQFLYHWDSVNFALSLREYNIAAHQPHPPGYFLYSMLGTLLNTFVQNENASLVWISVFSGILGIIAMYWLGSIMFDRRTGFLAALLTLVSPQHWFYSETALSYQLEFLFVILVAGLSYQMITGQEEKWPWLAVLIAVAGGFRLNTLFFILPLWVLSLTRLGWRERFLSVAIFSITFLAWFLPMIQLTGGLSRYLMLMSAQSSVVAEDSSLFSMTQVIVNFSRTALYTLYGITIGIVVWVWGAWNLVKNYKSLLHDRKAWIFAFWLVPSFSFYTFMYVRQHGHIFTYLPGILLLTALLLVHLGDRLRTAFRFAVPAMSAFVIVINGLFFLFAPAQLLGSQQLPLQTTSLNTIKMTDRVTGEWVDKIRQTTNPSQTAVFAGASFFRHPDYYLSDYQFHKRFNDLSDIMVDLGDDIDVIVLVSAVYSPDVLAKCDHHIVNLSSGVSLTYIMLHGEETFSVSKKNLEIIQHK
jgi:4-amino-4-deoxy-L-arabinose transferase-like glycosyltransferase